MNMKNYFNAVNQGQSYEIVVAVVIIVLTVVVLFFLYKNVMNALRENKKEKHLLNNGNILNDILNTEIISDINHDILIAHEDAIRVFYNIDIDNFSYFTNIYKAKDIKKIYNEIENRLMNKADGQHLVSHLKKDKFIFYYKGHVESQTIKDVADDLLKMISEKPFNLDDIKLTVSIGISVFPEDARTAEALLDKSNLALHLAQKQGHNRYYQYSEEQIEKEKLNIDYYQDIKKSIENHEFILYYQPIVDIETGHMIGMESLLRWNHPEMGVLVPSKFLKEMDVTGNITWFALWGFERVVCIYKKWSEDLKIKDLFLSINLSPKQLYIENLADRFHEILEKYGLEAKNFVFEVLEYYTVLDNEVGKQNISNLRHLGFKVAIDETGDDFQLIDEMKTVEADIIKIPRMYLQVMLKEDSLVENIESLIKVSKENNKLVIIEGVETEDTLNKIKNKNLRYVQGYYFSQPVDIEDAKKMLKKVPWKIKNK
ncbi:GGDEF domain-containing phosphodiesterase [Mycoplasmatota bacterium]|nr:GGDEF domain-containing phosphodiesterase [Mycoplasmatota bacterium]